jgi:hypothetical protein
MARKSNSRINGEADDENPAKLQKRLDTLNNSMSAKRNTLAEAQAAVEIAQKEYSNFAEEVLEEVHEILTDGRRKGQAWTATAVRRQIDRFQNLGKVVRAALVPGLLEPLEASSEIQSALQIAQAEHVELTKKLKANKQF